MFALLIICTILLFSINLLCLLVFLQLKNIQLTLNRQVMNNVLDQHFKSAHIMGGGSF